MQKKLLITTLVIILLVAAGYVGYSSLLGIQGVTNGDAEGVAPASNAHLPEVDKTKDDDGDSVPDYIEEQMGLSTKYSDSDNDSLSDWYEINVHKTDPTKYDTDGDEASDGLEIKFKTDPFDTTSFPVFE